jgi:hypothetical protein
VLDAAELIDDLQSGPRQRVGSIASQSHHPHRISPFESASSFEGICEPRAPQLANGLGMPAERCSIDPWSGGKIGHSIVSVVRARPQL